MSEFLLFLELGLEHILDIQGYDHILFIVALSSMYHLTDYKKIALLITAFTIGHGITLTLATTKVMSLNPSLTEILIPITIFITAIQNIFRQINHTATGTPTHYPLALVFGLIHGLGFSYYLQSMLGQEQSILLPLFSFHIGLELGQIIIVISTLFLSFLCLRFLKIPQKIWVISISSSIAIASLLLIAKNSNM